MQKLFFVLFSCCVVFCVGYKSGCGPNQVMRCELPCPPEKTCRNRGVQFYCFDVIEPCVNRCVCKDGFYRNAVGDCVTNEQCDKCSGANEYFACGGACDNVCSSLHTENKTNCPIKNVICNPMCYCDDGFARDDKGNCIPIQKCQLGCGENEMYTDCKKSCPPDVCISLVAKFKCDSQQPCQKGCVCQPGYLREHADSSCKPICQCPQMLHSPDCGVTRGLSTKNE